MKTIYHVTNGANASIYFESAIDAEEFVSGLTSSGMQAYAVCVVPSSQQPDKISDDAYLGTIKDNISAAIMDWNVTAFGGLPYLNEQALTEIISAATDAVREEML